jgi:hypothetical protein
MRFLGEIDFPLPLKKRVGRAHTRARLERERADLARAEEEHRRLEAAGAADDDREAAALDCETARVRLRKSEAQFMHKWAAGFASLSFLLLGAPTAMLMRTANCLGAFFVCFLPIILLYQPLQKLPIIYAGTGSVPAWCVWIADIVPAAIGGLLMRIADDR